jgi:ABC-type nitrate/sulfonate/bicarbonate transport system ATPase subunit
MRQRAMIALALSCRPSVLLADEPTTTLDVTVQIQIILLLRRLQRELGMAVIFVTHDVGVSVAGSSCQSRSRRARLACIIGGRGSTTMRATLRVRIIRPVDPRGRRPSRPCGMTAVRRVSSMRSSSNPGAA